MAWHDPGLAGVIGFGGKAPGLPSTLRVSEGPAGPAAAQLQPSANSGGGGFGAGGPAGGDAWGRGRVGAVSGDADADAEAAQRLGAPAHHFDSLKRHVALKADRHRALFGPWRSQMVVSILGVLPLLIRTVVDAGAAAPHAAASAAVPASASASAGHPAGPGPTPAAAAAAASTRRPDAELSEALSATLSALSAAAAAHQLPRLGAALAALAGWRLSAWRRQPGGLEARLSELCTELRSALFPAYSATFLHHCLDLIVAGSAAWTAQPGPAVGPQLGGAIGARNKRAHKVQAAALLMLRCMFEGAAEDEAARRPRAAAGGRAGAAAGKGQAAAAAVQLVGAAEVMMVEPGLLAPITALLQVRGRGLEGGFGKLPFASPFSPLPQTCHSLETTKPLCPITPTDPPSPPLLDCRTTR
jgi:hypothetical protein